MPYIRLKLTLNQEVLDNLRQLPVRAQRNIKQRIRTELAPELEQDARELMAQGPALVSPFVFGSRQSARYFFWLVRHNPELSDGLHWIRTGIIEQGWRAEVSDRFSIGMITIRNIQPDAKYVYGPWAVAGHINTGWPEEAQSARALLVEKARERVYSMWKESVHEAAQGQG